MSKELELRGDLGKALSKIVDSMYIPYLLCYIEKIKRGDTISYRWNEITYETLESAKAAVQIAYDLIQHSLETKKPLPIKEEAK